MEYLKKIIIVLIGTFFIGLGVSFTKLSGLGTDALTALVFSIQYLIDIPFFSYTVCYLLVNGVFFILMLFFEKDKIKLGTILNFGLTGLCCDICIFLIGLLNIESSVLVIRILYSLIGILIMSFGIALYGGAKFGLAPYDVMPILISRVLKKVKYGFARVILDGLVGITAFILGFVILDKSDLIGINTILMFLFLGSILPYVSRFVSKYILKTEENIFE